MRDYGNLQDRIFLNEIWTAAVNPAYMLNHIDGLHGASLDKTYLSFLSKGDKIESANQAACGKGRNKAVLQVGLR